MSIQNTANTSIYLLVQNDWGCAMGFGVERICFDSAAQCPFWASTGLPWDWKISWGWNIGRCAGNWEISGIRNIILLHDLVSEQEQVIVDGSSYEDNTALHAFHVCSVHMCLPRGLGFKGCSCNVVATLSAESQEGECWLCWTSSHHIVQLNLSDPDSAKHVARGHIWFLCWFLQVIDTPSRDVCVKCAF